MRALALSLIVLLTGCGASSGIQPSRSSMQFMSAQKVSDGELLLFGCNAYTMNARGQWESTPCVPIEITGNPADIEAWQFEQRVRVRGPFRIPMGRLPVDTGVVGSRDECERVRAQVIKAAEDRPTEPCEGPVWFRYKPEGGK